MLGIFVLIFRKKIFFSKNFSLILVFKKILILKSIFFSAHIYANSHAQKYGKSYKTKIKKNLVPTFRKFKEFQLFR